MTRSDFERRAVITGIGPLTAIGTGRAAFWDGLLAERSPIQRLSRFDASQFGAQHAVQVDGFEPARHFPPHRLKRLDRYSQFALASAKLALDDAGLQPDPADPDSRFGVSFGTALGGVANAEEEHTKYLERGAKAVTRSLALQVFGGAAHSNIAIEFGLRGPGTTNSNSCASANVALGDALSWIRNGKADVVVAGAAEAPLAPLTFCAFDIIHTMSRYRGEPPGHAYRPFDRARSGFVMGEGACSFVVEEYRHAAARGATVYAELLGCSLNNEAHHMTTPSPDGAPVRAAIADALADAEVDRSDIDLISAHASGTELNDRNEAEAIRAIFGEHTPEIPVIGTKPYTGHPLGATGALEAAACLLAMRHGWTPPTLHLENPEDWGAGFDFVPNHGREMPVRTALTNAFGFGGINSCIVLRTA